MKYAVDYRMFDIRKKMYRLWKHAWVDPAYKWD